MAVAEFAPLRPDEPVTQEALLPYRHLGDPLADATIEAIFSTGEDGLSHVHRLLKHLVKNDHPLLDDRERDEESLPPEVVQKLETYFVQSDGAIREIDPELVRRGETVFANHGPEILMLLATYSLPASYTARRGVQVLAQTGRLESQPVRRLIETTQMVIDVMTPGGLARGDGPRSHGKGVRSAQKVRLMHAAIRRLILERYGEDWVESYGVPINQMDLCGTLMTFSAVILDGLEMLRVKLSDEEKAAYLYAWQVVGEIVGVHESLIPRTVQRADELKDVIRESEIGRSEQGIELTRALILAYQRLAEPKVLAGLPVALMRRFLGSYADVLEVPKADWTGVLVSIMVGLSGVFDFLFRTFRFSGWVHRKFALFMIDVFLRMERGGSRPSFDIPDHLADGWGLSSR